MCNMYTPQNVAREMNTKIKCIVLFKSEVQFTWLCIGQEIFVCFNEWRTKTSVLRIKNQLVISGRQIGPCRATWWSKNWQKSWFMDKIPKLSMYTLGKSGSETFYTNTYDAYTLYICVIVYTFITRSYR